MTEEQLIRHEAAHCAACLLLSIPVFAIDVIGDATRRGWVLHGTDVPDVATARRHMLMTLVGPLMAADHSDDPCIPTWPLDPNAGGDEGALAAYARALRWDEDDWVALRADAWALTALPAFDHAVNWLCGALEVMPRLDGDQLRALVQAAERTR
jgi:hypothetical protein